jgi:hypothetical protein
MNPNQKLPKKTERKKGFKTMLRHSKTHSKVSPSLSFSVGYFTPILPPFYPSQFSDIKKPTVTGWFF